MFRVLVLGLGYRILSFKVHWLLEVGIWGLGFGRVKGLEV